MLTNTDLVELTALRRTLHQFPEISGQEAATAQRICTALAPLAPSQILTNLGGHGVEHAARARIGLGRAGGHHGDLAARGLGANLVEVPHCPKELAISKLRL